MIPAWIRQAWPKLIFMNWKTLTSNEQSVYEIGPVVRSRAPFGALEKGWRPSSRAVGFVWVRTMASERSWWPVILFVHGLIRCFIQRKCMILQISLLIGTSNFLNAHRWSRIFHKWEILEPGDCAKCREREEYYMNYVYSYLHSQDSISNG